MSAAGLFETVKDALKLESDSDLARHLGCQRAVISNMRHGHCEVSAPVIVAIHEATGWPTKKIKAFINYQDPVAP